MPAGAHLEGARRGGSRLPAGCGCSSSRRDGSPSTARRPSARVDPARPDRRRWPAARHLAPRLVHLLLHKPAGVTSTARDRHAAPTVSISCRAALVPGDARLYPVGRLDQDSEGLILLTNDGPWADAVSSIPAWRGTRIREWRCVARWTGSGPRAGAGHRARGRHRALHGLREQTRTETRRLAELLAPPVDARLVWYRATLDHGWKRQLRRMFAQLGVPVARLARVRIGPLRLEDLASGESRALTPAEVRRLRAPGTATARPDDPQHRAP